MTTDGLNSLLVVERHLTHNHNEDGHLSKREDNVAKIFSNFEEKDAIIETRIWKRDIVLDIDRDEFIPIWDIYGNDDEVLDVCDIEGDVIFSSVEDNVHEFTFDSPPIYDIYKDKEESKEDELHKET